MNLGGGVTHEEQFEKYLGGSTHSRSCKICKFEYFLPVRPYISFQKVRRSGHLGPTFPAGNICLELRNPEDVVLTLMTQQWDRRSA